MSLKLIDKILENWKDPDYEGIIIDIDIKNPTVDELTHNKIIKDIEELRYIKPSNTKINSYESNQLLDYYNDYNFKSNGYEINDKGFKYEIIINDILKKNTKHILEVGFNAGFLTSLFLFNSDAHVTSIGLMNYNYTWYGKLFIDYKFQNKHTFIMSTINNLVPLQRHNIKYDIIWIDGNYPNLYETILNLREHSNSDTTLVISSICPHIKLDSYITILKLIKEGILSLYDHIKINKKYKDSLVMMKFDNIQQVNAKLLKSIELNIPLEEFRKYIYYKNGDVEFSNSNIKLYANKLIEEGIILDKKLLNYIKENFNINIE